MNRFTNYFGAEALMKIDSKVKTIQNKLIDITDMLELLELTSKNISDKLCPAELHLTLAMFESIKKTTLEEITSLIEKATTEDQQKKVSEEIDQYNKFAVESQANWSESTKKVYDFTLRSLQYPSKIKFPQHDLQYKISNLKELAISLSSNIEEDYKIGGNDPLLYLSSMSGVFEDLESLIEDWIYEVFALLTEKIATDSIQEIESTKIATKPESPEKPKKHKKIADIPPTSGLCGGDCLIL